MVNVDTKFLYNNLIPLGFCSFFNSYLIYLYWTNSYQFYEHTTMLIIGGYEFLDLILELRSKHINKEFLTHHICATIGCFLMSYNYDNPFYQQLIKAMIYCQCLTISTNLFLNLQFLFPKSIIAKLFFMIIFIVNRLVLTSPFMKNMILGKYYHSDTISTLLHGFCYFFYLLSLYWAYKILKKFQKRIYKKQGE
jgi:hypothetical protein